MSTRSMRGFRIHAGSPPTEWSAARSFPPSGTGRHGDDTSSILFHCGRAGSLHIGSKPDPLATVRLGCGLWGAEATQAATIREGRCWGRVIALCPRPAASMASRGCEAMRGARRQDRGKAFRNQMPIITARRKTKSPRFGCPSPRFGSPGAALGPRVTHPHPHPHPCAGSSGSAWSVKMQSLMGGLLPINLLIPDAGPTATATTTATATATATRGHPLPLAASLIMLLRN